MNHTPREPRKTVGFVPFGSGQPSGLSRYAGSLYRAMLSDPPPNLMVVPTAMPRIVGKMKKLLGGFNIDAESFLHVYPLALESEAQHCDLVHLTHRTQSTVLLKRLRMPVVVTVPDIIHYQHRHDRELTIYRHAVQGCFDTLSIRLLARADAVIACSDYTRGVLISDLGLDPSRVHAILEGVDSGWFRPTDVPESFYTSKGLDRSKTYILHVGTEEARKNVLGLLSAFARIHAEVPNSRLLRVGRPHYADQRARVMKRIEELGLGDSVMFFDDVSDQELVYFYNLASVLVFPSLAEGFGLPVLEAMACGRAVVCSNTTSLPEVAGDAAILVRPDAPDQIASAVIELLRDEQCRGQLEHKGRKRATGLTWAKTGEATMAVYQGLLACDSQRG
jgi:glycosyltransferase involved in cell wall biosynthesis